MWHSMPMMIWWWLPMPKTKCLMVRLQIATLGRHTDVLPMFLHDSLDTSSHSALDIELCVLGCCVHARLPLSDLCHGYAASLSRLHGRA